MGTSPGPIAARQSLLGEHHKNLLLLSSLGRCLFLSFADVLLVILLEIISPFSVVL
jgi:hypothetical protein